MKASEALGPMHISTGYGAAKSHSDSSIIFKIRFCYYGTMASASETIFSPQCSKCLIIQASGQSDAVRRNDFWARGSWAGSSWRRQVCALSRIFFLSPHGKFDQGRVGSPFSYFTRYLPSAVSFALADLWSRQKSPSQKLLTISHAAGRSREGHAKSLFRQCRTRLLRGPLHCSVQLFPLKHQTRYLWAGQSPSNSI